MTQKFKQFIKSKFFVLYFLLKASDNAKYIEICLNISVAKLMKEFTCGKLSKAFKAIPHVEQWDKVFKIKYKKYQYINKKLNI